MSKPLLQIEIEGQARITTLIPEPDNTSKREPVEEVNRSFVDDDEDIRINPDDIFGGR